MKIAYISSSGIPSRKANSIHVMKMCQAFVQEGHQPTLVVPRIAGLSNSVDDLWRHYGVTAQFPIIHQPSRLAGHDFYLRALLLARRRHADIIYTRHLAAGAWAAWLGIPVIYEAHSPPHSRSGAAYLTMLARGRSLQHIVVITDRLRHYLQSEFPALRNAAFVTAADGVDLERFATIPSPPAARAERGLPQQFTVGYAGHLYRGRGIELLFDVAAQLADYRFLLIGGADQDVATYRNLAHQRGLTNVTFSGFIANADLPAYLAACDLLLMPYQRQVGVSGQRSAISSADWMSPMKMFEYMAMQRLIVSSDLPALREILNETNAVLCPPEDVAVWRDAIACAAEQPQWRATIAQQARRDVEQYSWRNRISTVLGQLAND